MDKELSFPDAKVFGDIFEAWEVCPNLSPDNRTPSPEGWNVPLNEHPSVESATITCSLNIRGERRGWIYAKPTPEVIAWIRANMLQIDYDSLYFQAIMREGGQTLIVCQYNAILGSRWLALVDSETIPVDPHHS